MKQHSKGMSEAPEKALTQAVRGTLPGRQQKDELRELLVTMASSGNSGRDTRRAEWLQKQWQWTQRQPVSEGGQGTGLEERDQGCHRSCTATTDEQPTLHCPAAGMWPTSAARRT